MENKVTCDTILNQLQEWIETRQVVSADTWLNGAGKLNILRGDEHNLLFDLQQAVATAKVALLEQNDSVAMSKVKVEAMECYKQMCRQKAKLERIEETIRIAKLQARLANEEYRHSNLN